MGTLTSLEVKTREMRIFVFLLFSFALLDLSQSLSVPERNDERLECYSCTKEEDIECSEAEKKECEPGVGCIIVEEMSSEGDKTTFRRDCSDNANEEDGCDESGGGGGGLKRCHCSDGLCNKNWATAGWTENTELICYSCNSEDDPECQDENLGDEQTKKCRQGERCVLSEEVVAEGDRKIYRRDCEIAPEDECTEGGGGGGELKKCYCSTDRCNRNWSDAGYVDPTETPDALKCYKCNSEAGEECSQDVTGIEQTCDQPYGCIISEEIREKQTIFVRDCLLEPINKLECKTINAEGTTLKSCSCNTELCNRNWVDAGSTPSSPTDSPTEPPNGNTKCYHCDSRDGDCNADYKGEEIDCPSDKGCSISLDKDKYTRGCSETTEEGCKIFATERTCNCKTDKCNEDWITAGAEEKIMCYSCDSNEGECDEEHPGTEIECKVTEGCVINKDTNEGKTVFMRGCSGVIEPTPGCNNMDNATTCFCLSEGCNKDWTSAGSTTVNGETTPSGPTLKCYQCDSAAGDCTDEVHGDEVDCPTSKGCTIRKTIIDGGEGMTRGCSDEKDALCDTVDNGDQGGITKFCNCDTSLCNANWEAAGSTTATAPPETTQAQEKTTADPNTATVKHSWTLGITLMLVLSGILIS